MASPIVEGSKNASVFSSKDITILHENILVYLSKDFKTAQYIIEYTIKSDVEGAQIPLLFLAKDYKDNFAVWLDGKLVNIQDIPKYITASKNTKFEGFVNSFNEKIDENYYVSIDWQANNSDIYSLDDLKYFETNLSKGEHKIKVGYTAKVWIDKSNEWVNEYSFRYSLAPAKYWKSFGSLNITVFQDGNIKPLTTNLGNPTEGKFNTISNWKFNKLPSDNFNIIYNPKTSPTAKTLIAIDPFGIAFLAGIILMLLHFCIIFWFRKKNVTKKYTWIVILGSLLIPILILFSFMESYVFIDYLIGDDATKRHGYYFLAIIWYPILVPIYMTIMWVIDIITRKKLTKIIK